MRKIIEAGTHCSTGEFCDGCVWHSEPKCFTSCVEKFAKEIVRMSADTDDSEVVRASRICAQMGSCVGCVFDELGMRDCLQKLSTELVHMNEERK